MPRKCLELIDPHRHVDLVPMNVLRSETTLYHLIAPNNLPFTTRANDIPVDYQIDYDIIVSCRDPYNLKPWWSDSTLERHNYVIISCFVPRCL